MTFCLLYNKHRHIHNCLFCVFTFSFPPYYCNSVMQDCWQGSKSTPNLTEWFPVKHSSLDLLTCCQGEVVVDTVWQRGQHITHSGEGGELEKFLNDIHYY